MRGGERAGYDLLGLPGRRLIVQSLGADCLFLDEIGLWELEGGALAGPEAPALEEDAPVPARIIIHIKFSLRD